MGAASETVCHTWIPGNPANQALAELQGTYATGLAGQPTLGATTDTHVSCWIDGCHGSLTSWPVTCTTADGRVAHVQT